MLRGVMNGLTLAHEEQHPSVSLTADLAIWWTIFFPVATLMASSRARLRRAHEKNARVSFESAGQPFRSPWS